MPMKGCIVTQAGPDIGLGHLTRSLALARALRERNAEPRLLIWGPRVEREDLADFEHEFLEDGDAGAPVPLEYIRDEEGKLPDVLAVDLRPNRLPPWTGPLLDWMGEEKVLRVGVDGPKAFAGKLDLLFIPSFIFPGRDKVPPRVRVRWGWDCLMVNRQLEPAPWKPGPDVLVLTGGGGDPRLNRSLPALLDRQLPEGARLHWVRGPYADQPEWPEEPRLEYHIHHAPPRLDELMQRCSYALTVYGVTLFELFKYGVPAVVFSPYGERDTRHLEVVAEEKAALTADSAEKAVARLASLMESNEEARRLSRRSRELTSKDGAAALAEEILTMKESL